jgi:hypothetical protein
VFRAVVLALLVVAAVYFAAHVIGAANRPTDFERLQAQPEFSLFYPGSIVVEQGGYGRGFMVPSAAVWRLLSTDASQEDVLAFYRDALGKRGWEVGAGAELVIDRGRETQACGWHTNTTTLRLALLNMDEFRRIYSSDARFATAYRLGLFDEPPSASITCIP